MENLLSKFKKCLRRNRIRITSWKWKYHGPGKKSHSKFVWFNTLLQRTTWDRSNNYFQLYESLGLAIVDQQGFFFYVVHVCQLLAISVLIYICFPSCRNDQSPGNKGQVFYWFCIRVHHTSELSCFGRTFWPLITACRKFNSQSPGQGGNSLGTMPGKAFYD